MIKHLKFLVACIFFSIFAWAGDPTVTRLVDKKAGIDATVVTFQPEDNRGFAFIDVPAKIEGDTILKPWRPEYQLMLNGGYFNQDFSPTGFCKIDGQQLNGKKSEKLSGFVVLDKAGTVSLLGRDADVSGYPNVIQNGPFVIDPGGRPGIRRDDGKSAERTLIGKTKDKRLVIVVTQPITLYALSCSIKKQIPELDCLLNLDGGPSTALKITQTEILNRAPVRNYIARKKDRVPPEKAKQSGEIPAK